MDTIETPTLIDNGVLVAALFALVTDWDQAEIRAGRRGEYRTTGASMHRLRTLTTDEIGQLVATAGTVGVNTDEGELLVFFGGDYEYQVSYACNRFATRATVGGQRLTANEQRTLERAQSILQSKPRAAERAIKAA